MSEQKAPKAKAYRINGSSLSIPGFPFDITEAMLNHPKDGGNYVLMIERHEKATGAKIFGTAITLA